MGYVFEVLLLMLLGNTPAKTLILKVKKNTEKTLKTKKYRQKIIPWEEERIVVLIILLWME